MKNMLLKIKYNMQRYMSGRYGMDQLNKDLISLYLLLYLFYLFSTKLFSRQINLLYYLSIVSFGFCIFRLFSKKIYIRQRENQVYLLKRNKILHPFSRLSSRKKDKEHKYYTCPCCRQTLRVPAGRGKIAITCPRCATIITKKT